MHDPVEQRRIGNQVKLGPTLRLRRTCSGGAAPLPARTVEDGGVPPRGDRSPPPRLHMAITGPSERLLPVTEWTVTADRLLRAADESGYGPATDAHQRCLQCADMGEGHAASDRAQADPGEALAVDLGVEVEAEHPAIPIRADFQAGQADADVVKPTTCVICFRGVMPPEAPRRPRRRPRRRSTRTSPHPARTSG